VVDSIVKELREEEKLYEIFGLFKKAIFKPENAFNKRNNSK
jgi:hypothetical protein